MLVVLELTDSLDGEFRKSTILSLKKIFSYIQSESSFIQFLLRPLLSPLPNFKNNSFIHTIDRYYQK